MNNCDDSIEQTAHLSVLRVVDITGHSGELMCCLFCLIQNSFHNTFTHTKETEDTQQTGFK